MSLNKVYTFQLKVSLFSSTKFACNGENFGAWFPPASRLRVRVNKCWISKSTKPIPNSTAENIKKKNVKESRFRLSKARPTTVTIAYSVIHKSSAVRSRCKEVFVWTTSVLSRNKKNMIKVLVSPKNKIK